MEHSSFATVLYRVRHMHAHSHSYLFVFYRWLCFCRWVPHRKNSGNDNSEKYVHTVSVKIKTKWEIPTPQSQVPGMHIHILIYLFSIDESALADGFLARNKRTVKSKSQKGTYMYCLVLPVWIFLVRELPTSKPGGMGLHVLASYPAFLQQILSWEVRPDPFGTVQCVVSTESTYIVELTLSLE